MEALSEDEFRELRVETFRMSRKPKQWGRLFRTTGLPVRFRDARLSELNDFGGKGVGEYVVAARNFVEAFEEHWRKGVGLTFIGPPGSGKTTAACCAAAEIARMGFVVRFTTMASLVAMQQRQMTIKHMENRAEEWERNDHWLAEVRQLAHLLVIDDVGKEYHAGSGYAENLFDTTYRYRVDEGLPTILTSNVRLGAWDGYSQSAESFLFQASQVVVVNTNVDLRRTPDAARRPQ